jgi:hypothetical protein
LAPLTQGWRVLRVENAADIERLKLWLIVPQAAALRELASYFWYAASRIDDIRAPRARRENA